MKNYDVIKIVILPKCFYCPEETSHKVSRSSYHLWLRSYMGVPPPPPPFLHENQSMSSLKIRLKWNWYFLIWFFDSVGFVMSISNLRILLCFCCLYNVEHWWYGKTPNISPGLILSRKAFLMGLYTGDLYMGRGG